jgi:hypothetical protein
MNVLMQISGYIKWHHTLSIIGIGYQLFRNIGGGIMVRLLLDSSSTIFVLLESLIKGSNAHKDKN